VRSQLADRPGQLKRQRMDFLLLLPQRARVVMEIDGVQHYSDNGAPSPKRYAEMVAEDRALRLARYEVYRFGGHELVGGGPAAAGMLDAFFDRLLAMHAAP
jgi:very-short-patch-repair endonuclease